MVIYGDISTLEITGIFITLTLNYLNPRKVGFFTGIIYHGKLPQYFYNTGPWAQCYGI